MNYLIFGDIHISQTSLKECEIVLQEIVDLCEKYDISHVISLGDNFDNNKPTALELNCLGKFVKNLGNRQIILLAAQSHESETLELSSVDIYGILSDNVKVVKEYKDEDHLYCGHFSLKESSKNYDAKLSKNNLKNYCYVFLGHIHTYQVIKPNVCHLGSARYVDFGEAKDKQKMIAIINNYNTEHEEVHFLGLKSPYPMSELKLHQKESKNSPLEAVYDTNLVQNPPKGKDADLPKSKQIASTNPLNLSQIDLLCQQLDKLPNNTKVKVKVQDFASFKEFLPLECKYKEKFSLFIKENDFELISDKQITSKSEIDLKESFAEFAKEKQIDFEIKDIINKEIK